MISLDTSVLVRYVTQDDATQSPLANRLIQKTLSAEHPADCLMERTGHAAGCDHTVTFDRAAVRDAGMRIIESAHG